MKSAGEHAKLAVPRSTGGSWVAKKWWIALCAEYFQRQLGSRLPTPEFALLSSHSCKNVQSNQLFFSPHQSIISRTSAMENMKTGRQNGKLMKRLFWSKGFGEESSYGEFNVCLLRSLSDTINLQRWMLQILANLIKTISIQSLNFCQFRNQFLSFCIICKIWKSVLIETDIRITIFTKCMKCRKFSF